ncbi:MAG: pyridoxal phosphate enzyme (YggS family) [Rhodothermales bacterium]|jgi:pyridoxal phosphate enzyme (YggS family)
MSADRHQLAENLASVRRRMAAACLQAGRDSGELTLVAVSKTFPLQALLDAAEEGQLVFGENKPQELASKSLEWADRPADVRLHMIGHLQSNKAGLVAEHADVFHALDSIKLAAALDRRCQELGKTLECYVQVNVSGEDSKFGLAPDDLYPFLDSLSGIQNLRITGLMTLAAPTAVQEETRAQFRLLRDLAAGYSDSGPVSLKVLSMGMSGDFEVAIQEGATHVRVGSAIFGGR